MKEIITITIIFILILTCGCIHIDFGNPFKSEKPKPPEYHIVTKEGFPMTHSFDISDPLNPDVKYSDTQPFIVKPKTDWVNISISIILNTYNFINDSPIGNYSLLDRYVYITILDPSDEKYYEKQFFESAEIKRQLSTPKPSDWKVLVEAIGLGYENIHDSYKINVIANEPI